jgi:hypothetical protein
MDISLVNKHLSDIYKYPQLNDEKHNILIKDFFENFSQIVSSSNSDEKKDESEPTKDEELEFSDDFTESEASENEDEAHINDTLCSYTQENIMKKLLALEKKVSLTTYVCVSALCVSLLNTCLLFNNTL